MSKQKQKKPIAPPLPEITPEEAEAIERDWEDEMLGEDADYFSAAGIDDIGNK